MDSSYLFGGFNGEILRINLTEQSWDKKPVPEEYVQNFLGARGLAARYYKDLVSPECNPFDPENWLIFCTGLLTGTKVPASTKFGLATKSPETGHYLCSNSGGNFGPYLKQSGFDGLLIEGKSKSPVFLLIEQGEVRFFPAEHLSGLLTSQVYQWAHDHFGKDVSVMCNGPAGENLVRFACIQVDGRSFGRGGGGAVMGSKNIKAIIVTKGSELNVAHPERLNQLVRSLGKKCRTDQPGLVQFGTAGNTEVMNDFGVFPTGNFKSGYFDRGSTIDAHSMKEKYWKQDKACWRCPIACAKHCVVTEGKYANAESDPEYESIWALGGQVRNGDFGAIVKANQLCDDYGIDTMSAGYMVGLAMDLFEDGMIPLDISENSHWQFCNPDHLIQALHAIAKRVGLGDLLAEGCKQLALKFPTWSQYMVQVKGMPFAGYDPRGVKGMALSYATSPRGACHNVGGYTISTELKSEQHDRFSIEHKAELVKELQDARAYLDSLGLCTQVRKTLGFTAKPTGEILTLVTGHDFYPELMNIGARVWNLERLIITDEGLTCSDDALPEKMNQPLPEGAAEGQFISPEDFGKMIKDYYRIREWDEQGKLTEKIQTTLNLR